jgi:hypothetical protein
LRRCAYERQHGGVREERRKVTDEEIRRSLGEEYFERHERTQRLLARAISPRYEPSDPELKAAVESARRESA